VIPFVRLCCQCWLDNESKFLGKTSLCPFLGWICFNWERDLHYSNRERSGFFRTRLWVVFQLEGLSLWGERERVWRRAEERRGSESEFGRKRRDLIITHQGLSAGICVWSGTGGKRSSGGLGSVSLEIIVATIKIRLKATTFEFIKFGNDKVYYVDETRCQVGNFRSIKVQKNFTPHLQIKRTCSLCFTNSH